MSESMKRGLIVVAVILALGIAAFSITRTVQSTQPHDAGRLGGGVANPANPQGKSKMGPE